MDRSRSRRLARAADGAQGLTLQTTAASAGTAQVLARGAADAFVQLVNADQASNVVAAADRLSASVTNPSTPATKTSGSGVSRRVAGAVAAVAVLVLAGVGLLVRRLRSR